MSPARSNRSRFARFASIPLAALSLSGAQAGNLAWLDFEGAIPGESSDLLHKNWITITTLEFSGASAPGQAATLGLRKGIDKASSQLFRSCALGTSFPRARLDLVRETATEPAGICRIELEDAVVVSQSTSGPNTNAPTELIRLGFRKITYTYFVSRTQSHHASFDYSTGAGSSGSTGDGTPNPDSDSDGLPDSWESTYGLSIGTNDSGADPDGDGFTNREEYLLGTHPKSGASFFRTTIAPNPSSPGNFTVTWNAATGKTYLVEWSPDLTTPFTTVATVTAASSAGSAPVTGNGAIGFYRVRLQE